MGRPPRLDFTGAVHHVVNRGVRKSDIFKTNKDRQKFCEMLDRYTDTYDIELLVYCLMSNHFHLVLRSLDGRLSDFMQALQTNYAIWFNQREEAKGHLFEGRFFSELVQKGSYMQSVVAYVLTNPHRAGVRDAESIVHPWTSLSEIDNPETIVSWSTLFDLLENVGSENFVDYLRSSLTHGIELDDKRRRVRDVRIVGNDKYLEQSLEKARRDTRTKATFREEVKAEAILKSICEIWDLKDPEVLLSSGGDHIHATQRYVSFRLLRERARMTLREIGEMFDLSPSTVSLGIKRARKLEDVDRIRTLWKKWEIDQSETD